jgi:hypothetical protein
MQRAFVWIQEDPGFHPGLFSAVPTGTGSFSVGLPSTVRWATARRPYRDWFPLLAAGVVCPLRTAVLLKQNGQHPNVKKADLDKGERQPRLIRITSNRNEFPLRSFPRRGSRCFTPSGARPRSRSCSRSRSDTCARSRAPYRPAADASAGVLRVVGRSDTFSQIREMLQLHESADFVYPDFCSIRPDSQPEPCPAAAPMRREIPTR